LKKYIAELIGTFLLAGVVSLSLGGKFDAVPTAVLAGLTLGVCVYTLGAISGTHINPSITLGVLSVGKISFADAAGYIVAQFLGGVLAMFVSSSMVPRSALTIVDSGPVFCAEIFGTFCLGLGVASVVFGKAPGPAAGLTIGGSLLFGLSIAATASNAVLNPAVAVGIGSVSVAYLTAPVVGAVIAFQIYRFISAD
jgi:glycerol uptake facilitator-like aquaporin